LLVPADARREHLELRQLLAQVEDRAVHRRTGGRTAGEDEVDDPDVAQEVAPGQGMAAPLDDLEIRHAVVLPAFPQPEPDHGGDGAGDDDDENDPKELHGGGYYRFLCGG